MSNAVKKEWKCYSCSSDAQCDDRCKHHPHGKQYWEGYEAAIKKSANICEQMVIGGRAWTEEQAIAADALFAAAANIKKLFP